MDVTFLERALKNAAVYYWDCFPGHEKTCARVVMTNFLLLGFVKHILSVLRQAQDERDEGLRTNELIFAEVTDSLRVLCVLSGLNILFLRVGVYPERSVGRLSVRFYNLR
jgi:hypothetical protein